MRKFIVSFVAAGSLIAAVSTQAALPTGTTPAVERPPSVQIAGYWSYAQCNAENRDWMYHHFMTGYAFTTHFLIGSAISCLF